MECITSLCRFATRTILVIHVAVNSATVALVLNTASANNASTMQAIRHEFSTNQSSRQLCQFPGQSD